VSTLISPSLLAIALVVSELVVAVPASAGTVAPAPSPAPNPGTTPPPAGAPAPAPTKFTYSGSVVHKGSGGQTIAFPDVCKTPSPSGPAPVPYPNAVSSASSDFPPGEYKLKGGGTIAVKGSTSSTSSGDEAGTAGGVASNKVKGSVQYMMYSFDVRYEGKNVVRMQDPLFHNEKNANPATTKTPVTSAPTAAPAAPAPTQSQLYELEDGTYCAVCMEKNRITKILKLRKAQASIGPVQQVEPRIPATN